MHETGEHNREARAETAYAAALRAANGAGAAEDWGRAVRELAQAAGLGHRRAGEEIALLGLKSGHAPPLAAPPLSRLSDNPSIVKLPALMSEAECAWVMRRAEALLRPAVVFDSESGQARAEAGRTNFAAQFDFGQLDLVLSAVRRRIADAAGVPMVALETTQVLSYAPGQTFDWHYDFLDPDIPGLARDISVRGQRIATCLVYLNSDYVGGETAFAADDLRYRFETGAALMWANTYPDGAPNERTLHAGLPPSAGRKWVLSQWIRDRPQY